MQLTPKWSGFNYALEVTKVNWRYGPQLLLKKMSLEGNFQFLN